MAVNAVIEHLFDNLKAGEKGIRAINFKAPLNVQISEQVYYLNSMARAIESFKELLLECVIKDEIEGSDEK